ncbi:DUF4422 domain-containing protein [Azospirillum doebereinerae]|uniref:DUF4422 domain-containing protein n=1 Tax=Azospirillum doebereinerae TaxID=92933 RepID=UPI001EE545BE|nr:DUF4422 domain-containing protein [Azospirillum doebereinerae]MCG5238951.1 DUF4422 domain-containing protein [Azospirillum doebereinerae]
MNMRIGLFTVHHKEGILTPTQAPFVPFMVGCTSAPPDGFMGDHAGVSLGSLGHNAGSYGDLRAQFSVWKNSINQYDVIGFQQYRRLYFFDNRTMRRLFSETEVMTRATLRHPSIFINAGRSGFERYIQALDQSTDEISSYIEKATASSIIVNRRLVTNEGMVELFKRIHDKEHWDLLVSILHKKGGNYPIIAGEAVHNKWAPYCNMFIARTEVFSQILESLFDIMFEVERNIDLSAGLQLERSLAYIAERLMAMIIIEYAAANPEIGLIDLPVVNYVDHLGDGIYSSLGRII